jgi:hypothetical protein
VPGFPIRTSTDPRLVGSSPWLIAASHVLLRLQAPRHSPLTLYNLENIDARARYGILKGRTTPIPDQSAPMNRPMLRCGMSGREASRATTWWRRLRVGGTESPRAAHLSRNRRSLPQNGIVMPIANHRAHRPHERDIRGCAVRQGRDMGDSE